MCDGVSGSPSGGRTSPCFPVEAIQALGLISASFSLQSPPPLLPLEAGTWSRRRRQEHQQDSWLCKILSAAGDLKCRGDQESPDHQAYGETPTFTQRWFPMDLRKVDLLLYSPCLAGKPGGARRLCHHPAISSHPPTPAPRLAFLETCACGRMELSTPPRAVRLSCPSLASPAFYFSMDKLNRDILGF